MPVVVSLFRHPGQIGLHHPRRLVMTRGVERPRKRDQFVLVDPPGSRLWQRFLDVARDSRTSGELKPILRERPTASTRRGGLSSGSRPSTTRTRAAQHPEPRGRENEAEDGTGGGDADGPPQVHPCRRARRYAPQPHHHPPRRLGRAGVRQRVRRNALCCFCLIHVASPERVTTPIAQRFALRTTDHPAIPTAEACHTDGDRDRAGLAAVAAGQRRG